MYRAEFVRKFIRLIMISVLALIAIMLGTRVVSGANCSVCPGSGICNGLSDCNNYSGNEQGKK